jgi:carboxyl-terminal processing protease
MVKKMRKLPLGWISVGVVAGVMVSLGVTAVAQKDQRATLPLEELRQLSAVFGVIKENYVEPVEDKKLITEAIGGMLSGLDPHSAYLDADAFRDLRVSTQGEFGGLGIEVGQEDGFVKVVSPIEDTPASRAGVTSGDLIVKIDDKLTKGMSLNDAVKLMRGKPKTPITLTIARKNETKPIVLTLIRDVIQVQSVKSKVIEPGYGYLRLTQFQDKSGENLVKHLNALYAKGQLKGLILDLRNDPGGVLHGAVGVSATFLPPRVLVTSTDGRNADSKHKYLAAPDDYLPGRGVARGEDYVAQVVPEAKKVPMVVLVNGGSASASEIVAGALQDHKRAVVMGTQTFGKGSVQTILPISETTAIKLTTARYFTPSGRSIQAKGIVPDLLVDETPEGDSGPRMREADLSRHLSNPKGEEAKSPVPKPETAAEKAAAEKAAADKAKDRKPLEFGSADDFQLQQALNHLKGAPVMVSKAKDEAPAKEAAAAKDSAKDSGKATK